MQAILAVTVPLLRARALAAGWRHSAAIYPQRHPRLNAFVLYFALPCMLFRFGMNTPILELLGTRRCWACTCCARC